MTQNNAPPLRLLIVEDRAAIAEALAEALVKRDKFQIVGVALNGTEALDLVKKHKPTLVLIDTYLKLGKADSIRALVAIKQYRPETRVLFLSQFAQPIVQNEIMAAGADGYLSKDRRLDELVMAIKMVSRGKKIIDIDDGAQIVSPSDQLNERERQIIVGICRGQSNREIGDSLDIAEATVRNSITIILGKLQCTNRNLAVTKARKLGYLPPHGGCE